MITFFIIIYITLSHATTTTNHLPSIYNSYHFNLNNASQWFTNQHNNSNQIISCTLQIPSLCIQYTSPPQQHINILYKDISFSFIQPSHDIINTLSTQKSLTIPPENISTRRRLRGRCRNVIYQRRTRTRPRRGNRIRNINFEDNMIISMEITVRGWPRTHWASIFHCGSRNTVRQPGLWINRNGKYFHIVYGIKRNWNQLRNYPRIRLGRKYKIEYRIRRNRYDVYVNGRRFNSVRGRHHNHRNQPCYLSDPWYEAANVYVENLKIIRGTDPRGGCPRGRWTGPYRIKAGNGKCLDIHGHNRNGGRLKTYRCHNGVNQRWYYHTGTHQLRIGSKHGKCLDVHGTHYRRRNNGGILHAWSCHGGNNQKFLRRNNQIKALNGKCVDVHGTHYRQRRNSGTVWLWNCHRGANQRFKWHRWGPMRRRRRRRRKRKERPPRPRKPTARERRLNRQYYKKMYRMGKEIGKIFKKDKDRRCGKKCKKPKRPPLMIPSFDPFNMGPVHPEYGLAGFIVDKPMEEQEKEKEEKEQEQKKKRRLIIDMDMRLRKCMLDEDLNGMNEICVVYYYMDDSMGMEYNVMVGGDGSRSGYNGYVEEYVMRIDGVGCNDGLLDIVGYVICIEDGVGEENGLDVILKGSMGDVMGKMDLGNDSEWDKIYQMIDVGNLKCGYMGKLEICVDVIGDDVVDVIVKKMVDVGLEKIFENIVDSE